MKKIIIFATLAFVIAIALAQSAYVDTASTAFELKKPVMCDKTKKIFAELINGEYQELPAWSGEDEKTRFVLLINQETSTWSIIQFDKETACILGVGEKSKVLNYNKNKMSL
jgi:hypothetical protein